MGRHGVQSSGQGKGCQEQAQCSGPSLPPKTTRHRERVRTKTFHFILNKMEQTELLEILKTMSSLQNFTEIIVRGVGRAWASPTTEAALGGATGAQWPGGPSRQARWWLCPPDEPTGPQGPGSEPTSSCQHRPWVGAGRGPLVLKASFRRPCGLGARPTSPRLEWKWW